MKYIIRWLTSYLKPREQNGLGTRNHFLMTPSPNFAQLDSAKARVLARYGKAAELHDIYFIPIPPHRIDVFCFFKTDKQLCHAMTCADHDQLQKIIIEELNAIKRGGGYGESLRFEFDSHENVLRSYQGNYGHRLR